MKYAFDYADYHNVLLYYAQTQVSIFSYLLSYINYKPSGRLLLLFTRHTDTFPAIEHHHP